ncbi:uncharacterized protein STEHIDRAFT_138832 [Stereum hirsutum FP-91666 SS1]|uniref:uncharacterized protein n=1 Tax=Stereum hirsutum (strain FP-91666) TaxID=721885 RepID=UPI000440CA17|nr:uncharacterized protein STEHIDRAFT_138832 [Stereum hirsutum FP-91666 SS1]EIM88582.1 hypothetical protein STEHIDRAFT_138832 [Stereum hirsutum FP-91666 SS1]
MFPAGSPDPTSPHPTDAVAQSSITASQDPSPTQFELLCAIANLPPPGLDHFEARRALWLTPPSAGDPTPTIAPNSDSEPQRSNTARTKLEDLLSRPGALESDEVWEVGLAKVWRGLVGGGRLKKALPLNIVIKILQAGWLRDGTWPEGAAQPTDDPFFHMPATPTMAAPHPSSIQLNSSPYDLGVPTDTTAWTVEVDEDVMSQGPG